MQDFDRSKQPVLGLLLVLAAGACSSDDDPVNDGQPTAGAAGKTSLSTGGSNSHVIATNGGTVGSNTSPIVGGAASTGGTITGGTSTGGTSTATTATTTFTSGGVAGSGSSLQYAGDGLVLRGGQGGTSATTSSGFAGLPVKRCRRNQDCTDFSSVAYLCFVPAVVSGCDDGEPGYCTGFGTVHCSLNIVHEPCGSCLMHPDGIQWEFPSESRLTTAASENFGLSCNFCTLPSSGGASGGPSISAPSCSDYLRNAAGNAGVAGCSANSAGSGGVN